MTTRDLSPGIRAPKSPRLDDPKVDKAVHDIEESIARVVSAPAMGMKVFKDIELIEGQVVQVAHGLGRVPTAAWCTPPRETAGVAGLIEEIRDLVNGVDRSRFVALRATGFMATIKVDVVVI